EHEEKTLAAVEGTPDEKRVVSEEKAAVTFRKVLGCVTDARTDLIRQKLAIDTVLAEDKESKDDIIKERIKTLRDEVNNQASWIWSSGWRSTKEGDVLWALDEVNSAVLHTQLIGRNSDAL